MTLMGLADSAPAMEVHTLQFCLSRETLTIVNNLGLTDIQKADQVHIVATLKRYVQGRINETGTVLFQAMQTGTRGNF